VFLVQPPQRSLDLGAIRVELGGDLIDPRRAAKLDEAALNVVADAKVGPVHLRNLF
jgi:hypothetical protein